MLINLAKKLFTDYMPKIHQFITEREERNKQMYALGVQSGEAIKDLTEDFKRFEERQEQVFLEMFEIYHEVLRQKESLDKGATRYDKTGLPRSIGDPDLRAKVAHYLDVVTHEAE